MRFRLYLLSVPLVLATGCSTIVHLDRPSGLVVKGRPVGAVILVDGVARSKTAFEPVFVPVDGGSGPHVIRVEKDGYAPQEFSVEKATSDWVWGNAAFAVFPLVAAAGVGIDAAAGKWHRLEPDEIDASLLAIPSSLSESTSAAVRVDITPPVVADEASDSSTNLVDNVSDDMDALLRKVLENN